MTRHVNNMGLWMVAALVAASVNGIGSAQAGVVLTGGLTLVQEGGPAPVPSNLALGGTAIALDQMGGATPHFTFKLNDGSYGNSFSWIGGGGTTPTSATPSNRAVAGVVLGSTPVTVASIAFGRDNTGTYFDRAVNLSVPYVLQYTQTASPTAAMSDTGNPATGWASIGTLLSAAAIGALADFSGGGAVGFGVAYMAVGALMVSMLFITLALRNDSAAQHTAEAAS